MGNWTGGLFVRALAAFVCLVAAVWLALWYFIPAPPHTSPCRRAERRRL